jgi:hypothetical protein
VADASRPRQTSRKVTTRPQVTGFPTALLLFAGKSATAYQSKMLRVVATRAAAVGPQDGKRRGEVDTRMHVARLVGKAQAASAVW